MKLVSRRYKTVRGKEVYIKLPICECREDREGGKGGVCKGCGQPIPSALEEKRGIVEIPIEVQFNYFNKD